MPHPAMLTTALHTEPCPRRVRAMVGGASVVDTTGARYVWEHAWYPQFYLPPTTFDGLTPSGDPEVRDLGTLQPHDLVVDGTTLAGAALQVVASDVADLVGWWHLTWDAAERWLEEDEVLLSHPRSPYVRVDALPSSRTVRVEVKGQVLAESSRPVLLFETGLTTRYYLPSEDVRVDLLTPNELRTSCPYKGTVSDYWDVEVDGRRYRNVAWRYGETLREAAPVRGMIAFLNEKVDLFLDDEPLPRPGR